MAVKRQLIRMRVGQRRGRYCSARADDRAKLEWLRRAAKEGFDDIARGDYVTLRSGREIDDYVDRLGEEARWGD
jgi:purine nucleoside permease